MFYQTHLATVYFGETFFTSKTAGADFTVMDFIKLTVFKLSQIILTCYLLFFSHKLTGIPFLTFNEENIRQRKPKCKLFFKFTTKFGQRILSGRLFRSI